MLILTEEVLLIALLSIASWTPLSLPVLIFLLARIHFLLFQNAFIASSTSESQYFIVVTCDWYFNLMKISTVKLTFLWTLKILLSYLEFIVSDAYSNYQDNFCFFMYFVPIQSSRLFSLIVMSWKFITSCLNMYVCVHMCICKGGKSIIQFFFFWLSSWLGHLICRPFFIYHRK